MSAVDKAASLRPEDLRHDWARTLAKIIGIEDEVLTRSDANLARTETLTENVKTLQGHQAKLHLVQAELAGKQNDVAQLLKAVLDTVPATLERVNTGLDDLSKSVTERTHTAVRALHDKLDADFRLRAEELEIRLSKAIERSVSEELARLDARRQELLELQREILQSVVAAQEKDRAGFIGRLFGKS